MARTHSPDADKPLFAASISQIKFPLIAVGLFSAVVNLLLLTGPLFMLQVYDRVLASYSVPTLVLLLVLVFILFVYLGFLDIVRMRILSRVGLSIDACLAPKAFSLAMRQQTLQNKDQAGLTPVDDVHTIRRFFSGSGPLALFDLPWLPLYLAVVYALHVWLGVVATAGALVLVLITILNELFVRSQMNKAKKDT